MVMWPLVTLIGFLVLTALVIAMGTQSTARYERERAEGTSGARHTAPEPVPAAQAA
jgi:multisubunit Na+/H+ antiporter MnhC subunit